MGNEFKILKGLSTSLFDESGNCLIQGKLINGAWYVTTDTYEVFACFSNNGQLELKKLNNVDLTNYVKFENLPDFSEFATKTYVDDAISNIADVDLSNYYTKTEVDDAIDSAVNNIDIPTVPTKVSELENDANFASETFVTTKIAEAQLNGSDVDLTDYVTKDQLAEELQTISSTYVKNDEIENIIINTVENSNLFGVFYGTF